jgi:hypothetical protein
MITSRLTARYGPLYHPVDSETGDMQENLTQEQFMDNVFPGYRQWQEAAAGTKTTRNHLIPHRPQPVQAQALPQEPPKYGMFEAHFNNAKICPAWKDLEYLHAYGSLYPGGRVHLDTRDVVVTDFVSFGDMRDFLDSLGSCRIVWLAIAPIDVSKFEDGEDE